MNYVFENWNVNFPFTKSIQQIFKEIILSKSFLVIWTPCRFDFEAFVIKKRSNFDALTMSKVGSIGSNKPEGQLISH